MEKKKKLPIGIDEFEKLREEDFYYIDKTGLIRELLSDWGMVNLFTRPRRFGKSLNMSMLESFFSINGKHSCFDGLEITKETEICKEYMGKYPVIAISLKGVEAGDFETAKQMLVMTINSMARKLQKLQEGNVLTEIEKNLYMRLLDYKMSDALLMDSLRIMSELLRKYYGQKVIILIDEYDVPLAKAFENNYYDQMVTLIRGFLSQALKTNENLKFAVLTGCMSISKESIFTGLNNLRVLSVADVEFDEYYGFTEKEVQDLLKYYELESVGDEIKEWYDGYLFGKAEVYCPWDVICFASKLRSDPEASPQNFWINTSSNNIVRKFIQCAADNGTVRKEIECLVEGGTVAKEIRQELTYREMYDSLENIWSVLFTTGYLTQRGKTADNKFDLLIPNMEIRNIFVLQIMEYFKENVRRDGKTLNQFCNALENGNTEELEQCLTSYLRKTISIRDTFVRKSLKENFYHGIILGILGMKEQWSVASNREAGDGYSDILVETEDMEKGIIIEIKYAHDGDLEKACKTALKQIEELNYEEELHDEGIYKILKYGIGFYKKRCRVIVS